MAVVEDMLGYHVGDETEMVPAPRRQSSTSTCRRCCRSSSSGAERRVDGKLVNVLVNTAGVVETIIAAGTRFDRFLLRKNGRRVAGTGLQRLAHR